jgi:outer membrane protein TolC
LDDLQGVDARTDAIIRERSKTLGTDTLAPSRAGPTAKNTVGGKGEYRQALEGSPASNNPDAAELRFVPADEARDVSIRLQQYYQAPADSAVQIDLIWALRQAHISSREFLTAEEEYVLAAIRLLIERHAFDPQFFATIGADVTATGFNGDYVTPLRILGELGVTQRLPDGGQVAARLVWDATEQLRDLSTRRYTQASALVLSAVVPLLRGSGPIAREDLIQAERSLVYAARGFESFRRAHLVDIAADYFDLVQQRSRIRNQERQLESLLKLEERVAALVEAGRQAEFEKNIASSRVLQARADLANQNEQLALALDRFKIRLGLTLDQPVALAPAKLEIPEPVITPQEAAEAAVAYRLDLQTTRDRLDDARRAVENARNGTLPDLNLGGSVTARTKPFVREGGLIYETDDMIFNGSVTFGLPLDRENERLALRSAIIGFQRSQRELDLARDRVVIEARSRVREIDRARFNLQLAEQGVFINQRRQEETELKRDELDTQTIVDVQNDLLQAENARDQAVTDLRNAILQYLLVTGQLRVARDGNLLPLPGMGDTTATDPEDQPVPPPPPPGPSELQGSQIGQ